MTALYDKVGRLSSKSLTQTSSGKLIALISADLFQVERGVGSVLNLIAVPFINVLALFFVVRDSGWFAMGVVLAVLAVQLILQYGLA